MTQIETCRMCVEIGLDLETPSEDREGLHESPTRSPVATQRVGETKPEEPLEHNGQQLVADRVATGECAAVGHPSRNHHVDTVVEHLCDHRRCSRRIVGGITVDHGERRRLIVQAVAEDDDRSVRHRPLKSLDHQTTRDRLIATGGRRWRRWGAGSSGDTPSVTLLVSFDGPSWLTRSGSRSGGALRPRRPPDHSTVQVGRVRTRSRGA